MTNHTLNIAFALVLGVMLAALPIALFTQVLVPVVAKFRPSFASCYIAFCLSALLVGAVWTALLWFDLITDTTVNGLTLGVGILQIPVYATVVRGAGAARLGFGPAAAVCTVQTLSIGTALYLLLVGTAQYWFFT